MAGQFENEAFTRHHEHLAAFPVRSTWSAVPPAVACVILLSLSADALNLVGLGDLWGLRLCWTALAVCSTMTFAAIRRMRRSRPRF